MKTSRIVLLLALLGASYSVQAAAPQALYTDIVSGPNSGGENDHGAYLTIYGRHFGDQQGQSQVLINGTPVVAYKHWSSTRISVQPGRAVASGSIVVRVNGQDSNADLQFKVRPGRIFFVALDGSDSTGRIGDISRPFRNAQKTFNDPDFRPGDFLVLRGGVWSDVGDYDTRFMNIKKDGTAEAPLSIVAYPGEKVVIQPPRNVTAFRFYRYNATVGEAVIANFQIKVSGDAVCVHMGYGSSGLRIVGNDAGGQEGTRGGAGCITGSVSRTRILGNTIHDNTGDKLYHALYIDNDQNPATCDDVEIAYNHIYNQRGPKGSGRGIQIYWERQYRVSFSNFRIHHNLIHDIDRDGILLGNQSGSGFEVHDNVIYRTGLFGGSGIRFNGPDLEARVYHNSIYDVARARTTGAVLVQQAKRVEFFNNIVRVEKPAYYLERGRDVSAEAVQFSNNLWFGAGHPPDIDRHPVNADPRFVDPTRDDFHLKAGSPAIDAGTGTKGIAAPLDMKGNRRPAGKAPDVGAFEYAEGGG